MLSDNTRLVGRNTNLKQHLMMDDSHESEIHPYRSHEADWGSVWRAAITLAGTPPALCDPGITPSLKALSPRLARAERGGDRAGAAAEIEHVRAARRRRQRAEQRGGHDVEPAGGEEPGVHAPEAQWHHTPTRVIEWYDDRRSTTTSNGQTRRRRRAPGTRATGDAAPPSLSSVSSSPP